MSTVFLKMFSLQPIWKEYHLTENNSNNNHLDPTTRHPQLKIAPRLFPYFFLITNTYFWLSYRAMFWLLTSVFRKRDCCDLYSQLIWSYILEAFPSKEYSIKFDQNNTANIILTHNLPSFQPRQKIDSTAGFNKHTIQKWG